MSALAEMTAGGIAAMLGRATGHTVHVESIVALSGGASSATYAIDAAWDGTTRPLILQRAATANLNPGAMSKTVQAELQSIAERHGLPVAAIVAVLEPGDGLGEGFVMARIAGEALAPRWLRDPALADARGALTGQCATVLARLHAIPLSEFAALPLAGGSGREQNRRLYETYRSYGRDSAPFDLAFAWLAERLDDAAPTALVHGDFRSGNFLIDENGLAAVLDWELAHVGNPMFDLGWLCVQAWRFGHWQRPVGGFGEREALYDAYEAAGGKPVDRAEAHVWEVAATLRWGMSCLQLADDHLSGRVPSVERAAIGRRVTEVEADLLYLFRHGTI